MSEFHEQRREENVQPHPKRRAADQIIDELVESVADLHKKMDAQQSKIEPVLEILEAARLLRKILAFTLAIGAIIASFFKFIWEFNEHFKKAP